MVQMFIHLQETTTPAKMAQVLDKTEKIGKQSE